MTKRFENLVKVLSDTARDKALLMIVPNWRNQFPLDIHPVFTNYLQSMKCDKVIHGYSHSSGQDWWNKFWFGTENHAEFSRLSKTEIMHRLIKARRIFENCICESATWFCAPRWRQSELASKTLIEAGFQGYMLRNCYVFSGKKIRIPTVYFDDGNRYLIKAGANLLRGLRIKNILKNRKPFRLVLHPSDTDDCKIWNQILKVIDFLEKDNWLPISLQEAISS